MKRELLPGVLLLVALLAGLGGCQASLFSNSDSYTQSRIDRYWDGDSAIQARQSRSKASENGFGFPTGMANQ